MAKVVFIYDGIKTDIYCNITDTIKEIVEKYSSKIQIDLNTLIFLYGGSILEINNTKLTFKDIANQIDLENKSMSILVNKLELYKTSPNYKMSEEVGKTKPKIKQILEKYLDDRDYLEDKVDRWKNAILSECNSLFSTYKEYKTFITLIIRDENQKNIDYKYQWFSGYKFYFTVEFKTQSIHGYIIVILFRKDIKRIDEDVSKYFEALKNEFLNLAEGRKYKIFKEKYYKMLKEKISEIRNKFSFELFPFHILSNTFFKASIGFIIVNKDKNDSFISETIKTDNINFYLLLAKVGNN